MRLAPGGIYGSGRDLELKTFVKGRPVMIRKLFKNEEGATAIEYGLIAALIAVAAITAMGNVGNTLTGTFNNVSNKMSPGQTS